MAILVNMEHNNSNGNMCACNGCCTHRKRLYLKHEYPSARAIKSPPSISISSLDRLYFIIKNMGSDKTVYLEKEKVLEEIDKLKKSLTINRTSL